MPRKSMAPLPPAFAFSSSIEKSASGATRPGEPSMPDQSFAMGWLRTEDLNQGIRGVEQGPDACSAIEPSHRASTMYVMCVRSNVGGAQVATAPAEAAAAAAAAAALPPSGVPPAAAAAAATACCCTCSSSAELGSCMATRSVWSEVARLTAAQWFCRAGMPSKGRPVSSLSSSSTTLGLDSLSAASGRVALKASLKGDMMRSMRHRMSSHSSFNSGGNRRCEAADADACSCCCCCWILALALLPFPFPPLPPPASALDALLPPEPLAVGAEGSRCVLSFVMPRSCAALMPSRMCFSAFRLYVRSAPRSVSRSSASNGTASTTAMRGRGAGRGCPSLRPPALAPELLFPAEVALTPSVPASAAMAAAAAAAASASAAAAASGTLRATKYRVCLLGDKYREMTLTSGGSPPEAS
mmetsp:Transcript_1521/g.3378  ORF Transcript_1521/g.3378 Transcript_1521/m.3378 type:complete len:413 (+) Transcript_1521:693-1931(+)